SRRPSRAADLSAIPQDRHEVRYAPLRAEPRITARDGVRRGIVHDAQPARIGRRRAEHEVDLEQLVAAENRRGYALAGFEPRDPAFQVALADLEPIERDQHVTRRKTG